MKFFKITEEEKTEDFFKKSMKFQDLVFWFCISIFGCSLFLFIYNFLALATIFFVISGVLIHFLIFWFHKTENNQENFLHYCFCLIYRIRVKRLESKLAKARRKMDEALNIL